MAPVLKVWRHRVAQPGTVESLADVQSSGCNWACPVWRSYTDTKFFSTAVHPYAGALWCLPLHGRGFTQRHPGRNSTPSTGLRPAHVIISLWMCCLLLRAQFWDRIKLYLMPSKHQPDFSYLRHVPLRRVHLFTLVQITCLAVLWILKSTFMAIIFPVMVCGKTSPLMFESSEAFLQAVTMCACCACCRSLD